MESGGHGVTGAEFAARVNRRDSRSDIVSDNQGRETDLDSRDVGDGVPLTRCPGKLKSQ